MKTPDATAKETPTALNIGGLSPVDTDPPVMATGAGLGALEEWCDVVDQFRSQDEIVAVVEVSTGIDSGMSER